MQRFLLVGLAGMAGTLGRYWLAGAVARRYGERFPFGTLAVNVTGCLLAGVLLYVTQERLDVSETTRDVLLVGLLGGFTTFSAYGLQTFALLRAGDVRHAAIYVIASNLAGLLTVWAGYTLARAV